MNDPNDDIAELDIECRTVLETYLLTADWMRAGELTSHKVLVGGVSSRTVLATFADGRAWVLKQSLAKLRVPGDWFSDPSRVHREALGMQVLGELAPAGAIPKLIFDDERHHVLAMEAVPEPHENWKSMLLRGEVGLDLIKDFGLLLGGIHGKSFARRDELLPLFGDRTFFESLRLHPYYEVSAVAEARAAEFYAQLIADTRAQQLTLVHGDYSPKNVLVRNKRLVLLDHEVIHFGDPAFDVGFALTHLLSKAHHLPKQRDEFADGAIVFWDNYSIIGRFFGIDKVMPVERCVRHTLGCLLARVVGRSPLEYLSTEERSRQREAVVQLIADPPADVFDLVDRFLEEIERE
ncbi:MAG: phosphotransferase [Planctomycetia bacterium]|nr:phosphotransferase [Planctomycetia bacterium]